MTSEKYQEIEKYLCGKMHIVKIEQRHDSSRCARTFKIYLSDGTRLLKISDEFVSDNTKKEILSRLARIKVTDALLSGEERGILLTQDGISFFDR